MSKAKVKVEIYEGDPFTGCCGPGIASIDAIERLRKMLIERNETVNALKQEFKEQLEIEREIVSSRRSYDTYPSHIYKLLSAGTRVPFIVINGQLVLDGTFPSLEDFRNLINKHIQNLHQEASGQ
jgi:hypothetical protein